MNAVPCEGHSCDQCATCKRGTCCKRDMPDYVLPKEGDWQGPIYGALGVLRTDGDKVECHACGGWYVSVGIHAQRKHSIMAFEYRAIFGLTASQGLDGESLKAKRSVRMKQMIESGTLPRVADHPEWRLTPEQISERIRGRRRSTQTLLRIRDPEFRARVNKKISDSERKVKTFTCVACGKVVERNAINRKAKTCSVECYKARISVITKARHAANRAKRARV